MKRDGKVLLRHFRRVEEFGRRGGGGISLYHVTCHIEGRCKKRLELHKWEICIDGRSRVMYVSLKFSDWLSVLVVILDSEGDRSPSAYVPLLQLFLSSVENITTVETDPDLILIFFLL